MSEDEQITGVSDNAYKLSSVLFHAAEGGQVYDKHIEDAERTGDEELARFSSERRGTKTPGVPSGRSPCSPSGRKKKSTLLLGGQPR